MTSSGSSKPVMTRRSSKSSRGSSACGIRSREPVCGADDRRGAPRGAPRDLRNVKRMDGREPVITIDGPAGAGKSTAAAELARRLGFRRIDTGALYRALAWAVKAAGLPPEDGPELRELLARTDVALRGEQLLVNGCDVTDAIRTPEISEFTSQLTRLGPVR